MCINWDVLAVGLWVEKGGSLGSRCWKHITFHCISLHYITLQIHYIGSRCWKHITAPACSLCWMGRMVNMLTVRLLIAPSSICLWTFGSKEYSEAQSNVRMKMSWGEVSGGGRGIHFHQFLTRPLLLLHLSTVPCIPPCYYCSRPEPLVID